MRHHLNKHCQKVLRENYLTDEMCETRVLDDLKAMIVMHVSHEATKMLTNLGKIKFPMHAIDHLHTGIGYEKWT